MIRKEGSSKLSVSLQKFYQPHLFYPSEDRIRSIVMSLLKGAIALDAGCGNGWLSVCAWEKGFNVFSFDIAENEIKESLFFFKEKRANIELAQASLLELPFASSSFDSIICVNVLEHVFDVKQALSEMRRVLKKNGSLVLMIPNGLTFGLLYDRFVYRLVPTKVIVSHVHRTLFSLKDDEISRLKLEDKEPIGHNQQFTIATIRKLLTENGFKITNVVNCRFLAPYLRSFCTLLGREPIRAFEEFDNKLAEWVPSSLVADWVIAGERF